MSFRRAKLIGFFFSASRSPGSTVTGSGPSQTFDRSGRSVRAAQVLAFSISHGGVRDWSQAGLPDPTPHDLVGAPHAIGELSQAAGRHPVTLSP